MDKNDRDLVDQGTDDSIKGKGNKIKGHLKDAAGGLTGDSSMQAEGKWDKVKGKVQDTVGKVERKLGQKDDESLEP